MSEQSGEPNFAGAAAAADLEHSLPRKSEQISLLERELAARDRHIAELQAQVSAQARSIHEVRAQLHAGRDLLEQRNGLILRLEAEAASSAAVLDSAAVLGAAAVLLDAPPIAQAATLGQAAAGPEPPARDSAQPRQAAGSSEAQCLLQAAAEGSAHLLARRTTIGRTPDNDLRVETDYISRHHAVILRSGESCVLEDLNSTNGTYVNGERINRRTLVSGDRIVLGRSEFHFLIKPHSG